LDMKLSRVTSQKKKKEVATRYSANAIDNTVVHCAKLQNFMHNMHRTLAGEQASVLHLLYLLLEPQGLLRRSNLFMVVKTHQKYKMTGSPTHKRRNDLTT
jgi:hypothetical protein